VKNLTSPEVQKFIDDHLNDDTNELNLRYHQIASVPIREIVSQIVSKRKAKDKLPTWFRGKEIIFPLPLSIEQSSSEETARYKSTLFSGKHAADLTGGFGVDSLFLSHSFSHVDYVEKEEDLLKIVESNFKTLGVKGCSFHCTSAEEYLETGNDTYDLIYLDPSRRAESNKVFRLNDCNPNVLHLQEELLRRGKHILIKTSPLLDIHKTLNDLKNVREVIVLSVKNEVKEVLYHIWQNGKSSQAKIKCVNIKTECQELFELTISEEIDSSCSFGLPRPLDYVYEPNSAILKAGAFKLIATRWGLNKLSPNTHFYTSENLDKSFPGRIFKVIDIFGSISKAQKSIPDSHLNIICRNYPLNPEGVKSKLKKKDGGENYLLGAKGTSNKKHLYYCSRVK
jgi:16S rRNA G966 N2-methylase RsmD